MKEDTIFINRELSWLDFNRRVLVLGKDKNLSLIHISEPTRPIG